MTQPICCLTVTLTACLSLLTGTCLANEPYAAARAGSDPEAQPIRLAALGSEEAASGGQSAHPFPGNKERHLREAAKYRLELDNDVAFGSDNQFSNGWSFQIHTPVADSWETLEGPANPIKKIGAWLPTLTKEGLKYRASLAIGQILQTPEEIENPNPIPNDVPYLGILALQGAWIAFNDTDFRGFEFTLGAIGRPSMAEQTQNFVHEVITGDDVAEGWDNQLEDEVAINLNYMAKKKFYRTGNPSGFSFDAAINGNIALGTIFTLADVRLETRFGSNMPKGFLYFPNVAARSLTYDATLAPPNRSKASFYGSLALGATAMGHYIGLDGNVFKDNDIGEDVEKEDFLGLANIGVHYERQSWGVHLTWTLTTDTIDEDEFPLPPGQDPENAFGTLMFEWRI